MTDENPNVTPDPTPLSGADETFAWTNETGNGNGAAGKSASTMGREWLTQLQTMIENVTEAAGPVLREVSAKAAELAAVAGEKAGPVAARAAELTAEAGTKLAEKSRDLAAELRRDQPARPDATETTPAPHADDIAEG
jgi:hypothetical protein